MSYTCCSQTVDVWSSAYDYTDAYGYDDANRLTSWGRTGAGAVSVDYAHDIAGNVAAVTAGGSVTTFTADDDNRLTRKQRGSAVTDYSNDAYGRRVREESPADVTTYRYNALGQLDRIIDSSAGSAFYYSYGISGMREMKERTAAGTWTKSVWDGEQLVAELDSDGTRYTYIWGPGRVPLALKVKPSSGAEQSYAYHTDAMGNVAALTSADGTVVAQYRYDPWGKVTYVGGTNLTLANRNPLRYRAYYYDTETGHYYLPARYYDPDTMRFLSQDPAPASAGDPLSLNRYTYCLGDPVGYVDSTGEVADLDGNGRIDKEDTKYHASNHTSDPARKEQLRAEVVKELEAKQALEVERAHREKAVSAIVGCHEASVPVGTIAGGGRLTQDCMFLRTRPDAYNWGFNVAGMSLEWLPAGMGMVPGLLVDATQLGYDSRKVTRGKATPMDVVWDGVCAVPYVTTLTVIGDTSLHYHEAYTDSKSIWYANDWYAPF